MRLNEVDIDIKNPGLLEVPQGKEVNQLPQSHFQALINKKGYDKVIRGLTNLEVWNKNKNPELSKWASNMADKLKKANNKDESLNRKLIESLEKHSNKIKKDKILMWAAIGMEKAYKLNLHDDKELEYAAKYVLRKIQKPETRKNIEYISDYILTHSNDEGIFPTY